jgi:hypothetical protein
MRTISRLVQLSGFTSGAIDIFADRDKDFDLSYFKSTLRSFINNYDVSVYINTEDKDFGEMPKNGGRFKYDVFHL